MFVTMHPSDDNPPSVFKLTSQFGSHILEVFVNIGLDSFDINDTAVDRGEVLAFDILEWLDSEKWNNISHFVVLVSGRRRREGGNHRHHIGLGEVEVVCDRDITPAVLLCA